MLFFQRRELYVSAAADRTSEALGDGQNIGWGGGADAHLHSKLSNASQGVTLSDQDMRADHRGIRETIPTRTTLGTNTGQVAAGGVADERLIPELGVPVPIPLLPGAW